MNVRLMVINENGRSKKLIIYQVYINSAQPHLFFNNTIEIFLDSLGWKSTFPCLSFYEIAVYSDTNKPVSFRQGNLEYTAGSKVCRVNVQQNEMAFQLSKLKIDQMKF